ncbi:unnamed protein product [Paramecium primaurelia]|uniref:Chromosome undetermined scaffold_33, whole genome shotgun sequence n=4 Tax=Paramecium TaxID=5884 RepID=Q3SDK1_PARTE|nr:uncharacterized protein GSPATT00012234001 [Paramecium tetraurelia]XP_001448169.1 uncharacterized protein GSPATT00015650001 [Paramecium tetraurelia]CAD8056485.1 unnamed protein product [Paramecium primaurelia]CAD8154229.1 unnamed protein product [Paramecium octaurelia]CAD8158384.1 unnamed protein product [Paramecium pentaurelia]CAD8064095.1 unnamed protein product [Paramecium primaurelia]CAD8163100.1 unnamed protein product [Paramecium pentaurelia]|eukprot:XP_001444079.1 hypothetical protein (macronuclear) [Paramecium tetraurelia strain d4-2]
MKRKVREYDENEFSKADLKIILLGDSAVGKSKLVERFLLDDYEERQQSTYALTMYRHNAKFEGKTYKIDLWDTAGQECFQTLHASYYYGAHACILCFDVTRKITYTNLKKWYEEMRQNCPTIPCLLVANKIDLDPSVTETKFKFAESNNLPIYYTSSADGTNVVKVFQEALKAAIEHKQKPGGQFMDDLMDYLQG